MTNMLRTHAYTHTHMRARAGNILDNQELISTLESAKAKAVEIAEKLEVGGLRACVCVCVCVCVSSRCHGGRNGRWLPCFPKPKGWTFIGFCRRGLSPSWLHTMWLCAFAHAKWLCGLGMWLCAFAHATVCLPGPQVSKITAHEIEEARVRYSPVAKRGAILFFVMASLSSITNM